MSNPFASLSNIYNSATAPSVAGLGDIYYDTALGALRVCTNAVGPVFTTLGASGGNAGGSITYAAGASGNWVCPTGITHVTVVICGGGGAGCKNAVHGCGGGAAGTIVAELAVTPGNSYAYSVGTGGVGGVGNGLNGVVSTFGILTARQGLGGTNATGGNGGNGSVTGSPTLLIGGGAGGSAAQGNDGMVIHYGSATILGGGGGSFANQLGGSAGVSTVTASIDGYGVQGGISNGATAGSGGGSALANGANGVIAAVPATPGFGGGGGGTATGATAGNGGPGTISLYW